MKPECQTDRLIDCPLCESKLKGSVRFAEHLAFMHVAFMHGRGICPCCREIYSLTDGGWGFHVDLHLDEILDALHARLLGINPHTRKPPNEHDTR